MFSVDDLEFYTSSYSQKETDWKCVGVGSECQCHTLIADSKTQQFYLPFDNAEFAAFIRTIG